MGAKEFTNMAKKIVEFFPSEDVSEFYLQGNNSKTGGRLYNTYRGYLNRVRKARQCLTAYKFE
jgi:hypothetical protein